MWLVDSEGSCVLIGRWLGASGPGGSISSDTVNTNQTTEWPLFNERSSSERDPGHWPAGSSPSLAARPRREERSVVCVWRYRSKKQTHWGNSIGDKFSIGLRAIFSWGEGLSMAPKLIQNSRETEKKRKKRSKNHYFNLPLSSQAVFCAPVCIYICITVCFTPLWTSDSVCLDSMKI